MKIDQDTYIRQLKKGQEAALDFIIDAYFPLVKAIVARVLSSFENAQLQEECCSDVFLSVWKNAGKFRGRNDDDFRKWLSAIAKYRAIDFYRRERSRKEIPSDGTAVLDFTAAEDSAEDQVLLQERRRELEELLYVLSTTDRNIFIMKFFWGMKSDEISQKMGLTKSAVDNRIYRGKKRLLAGLAESK